MLSAWFIVLLSIGWLFFLAVATLYFLRRWQALQAMKSWPVAQGEITELTLCEENNRAWPSVRYSYWVEDRSYTSGHWFADTIHNTPQSRYCRKLAYRVALAFKNNSTLDVYYNPTAPWQAVLDVRIPPKLQWITVLLGGLFIFEALRLAFGFFSL